MDYKYYKWLAIIPGWSLGGIIGGISSFLLVREILSIKEYEVNYELALLKICSQLIKTDGKQSEEEISLVKKFFIQTYGERKANILFKELKVNKKVPSDLNSLARTIKKQIAPSKLYSIIQFLFAVSASDGKISPQEESYIYNIGLQMGFKRNSLDAIKNQFVKTNNTSKKYDKKTLDSLNVLGLKGGATKEEIKIAYRNLVKEFHPDKLAGMGDGIKNLAKEKFQTIQHSYEYLNKNYV